MYRDTTLWNSFYMFTNVLASSLVLFYPGHQFWVTRDNYVNVICNMFFEIKNFIRKKTMCSIDR